MISRRDGGLVERVHPLLGLHVAQRQFVALGEIEVQPRAAVPLAQPAHSGTPGQHDQGAGSGRGGHRQGGDDPGCRRIRDRNQRVGGHGRLARDHGTLPKPLEGGEEKGAVLAKQARNRSAGGGAVLVHAQASISGGEEVPCRQIAMPEVLVERTMQLSAAGFRNHVHQTARAHPVPGGLERGIHAKFLDRLDRGLQPELRSHHRKPSRIRIDHRPRVDAVEAVAVMTGGLAAERQLVESAVAEVHGARRQQRQDRIAAAVQGHGRNLLGRDIHAQAGARQVGRNVFGNRNHGALGQRVEFQLDGARLAHAHFHHHRALAIARSRGGDLVRIRRQFRQCESAVPGRSRFQFLAAILADGLDLSAGDGLSRRGFHHAGDTGRGLRRRWGGEAGERHDSR